MTWDMRVGDCLGAAGMASLPDASVDVVITDPPYSEHVHAKSRRGLTVTHKAGGRDEINERRALGFEAITPAVIEAAADQFARLARRWVLVFCDIESVHLWSGALRSTGELEYVRTCAWHKLGGAPQFTGDRPAVWGEAIVCAHRPGRKRWNGGGATGDLRRSHGDRPRPQRPRRSHPHDAEAGRAHGGVTARLHRRGRNRA